MKINICLLRILMYCTVIALLFSGGLAKGQDANTTVKNENVFFERERQNDSLNEQSQNSKGENIISLKQELLLKEQELFRLRKKIEEMSESIREDTAEVNKYIELVNKKLIFKEEESVKDSKLKEEAINALKQQFADSQKEVEALKKENAQLLERVQIDQNRIAEKEELEEKLKADYEQIESFKIKLEETQKQLLQFPKETAQLQKYNVELSKQIDAAKKELDIKDANYQRGLEIKEEALKKKTEEMAILVSETDEAKKQLSELRKENEKLYNDSAVLGKKLEAFITDFESKKLEYEKNSRIKDELDSKTQLLTAKEEEIASLNEQLRQARKTLNEEPKKIEELEKENIELSKQIDAAENKFSLKDAKYQRDLEIKEEALKKKTEEMTTAVFEADRAKQQLAKALKEIEKFQADNAILSKKLEKVITDFESEKLEYETTCMMKNGEIKKIKDERDSLKNNFDSKVQLLITKEEEIRLLQQKLEEANKVCQEAPKEIENLKKENARLGQEAELSKKQLSEKEAKYAGELDIGKQQISVLNKQLEEANKVCQEAPKEIENLKKENACLAEEAEQAKEQLKESAKEVDILKKNNLRLSGQSDVLTVEFKGEKERLLQQNKDSEAQLKVLQEEIKSFKRQCKDWDKKEKEYFRKIEKLDDALAKKEGLEKSLEGKFSKKEQELNNKFEELKNSSRKQLETLQQDQKALQDESKLLQKENKTLVLENERLDLEKYSDTQEIKKAREELNDKQRQLNDAQKELKQLQEYCSSMFGKEETEFRVQVQKAEEKAEDLAKKNEQYKTDLERLRLQHEMILNSAGEGVFGLDVQGNVTFINPAALTLSGFEKNDLFGQNIHRIMHYQRADGTAYLNIMLQKAYDELTELKEKNKVINEDNLNLLSKVSEIKKEIINKDENIKEMQKLVEQKEQEYVNKLENSKGELNLQLKEFRELAEELKKKNMLIDKDKQLYIDQVNSYKEKIDALKKEQKDFKSDRSNLANDLKRLLKEQRDWLSKDAQQIKLLSEYSDKIDTLKTDIQKLQNENKGLSLAIKTMPDKLRQLEYDLDSTRMENASLHYNLGVFHTQRQEYVQAIDEFNKTLQLNENDATAHYNLGIIYSRYVLDEAKAISHFKHYLALSPNDKDAQKAKEYILIWGAKENKQ
ncbi:MAG: PAS domain-containing protein [Candidatus Omnitrophica bacterium]|nr:PAS domain-containing protein [Candidatus Omnitrophota bacterium]